MAVTLSLHKFKSDRKFTLDQLKMKSEEFLKTFLRVILYGGMSFLK